MKEKDQPTSPALSMNTILLSAIALLILVIISVLVIRADPSLAVDNRTVINESHHCYFPCFLANTTPPSSCDCETMTIGDD